MANNAVVGWADATGTRTLSLLGLGAGKGHADVSPAVFELGGTPTGWTERAAPPGSPGRLASTAQLVDGRVFLFGGYTVAPDGDEVSVARVDVYDPSSTPGIAHWDRLYASQRRSTP